MQRIRDCANLATELVIYLVEEPQMGRITLIESKETIVGLV